ncbi:MAG TPA: DUF692 domain-containing protein [Steroidobacteraceae bacterium]
MSTALGFGLGLRPDHYESILSDRPAVDWFEALTENYLVPGGKPLHYLARIRERYPVALHGVSMSIGGTDPIDVGYVAAVRALAGRIEAAWISDHLCWTGTEGLNLHDLLPLPYTDEALGHLAGRVRQVQDALGCRILLENVSTYVSFQASRIPEWEFLSELAVRADCLLLLDINNVYVNSVNHAFDPLVFLDALPIDRVRQIHLAGHEDHGSHIVDTHDSLIVEAVWKLYAHAARRFGQVATMIERDAHIPPLAELVSELDHARRIADAALAEAA